MFKLAYSTLPCKGWSPGKMLDYCKKYGYSGIELREGEETWVNTKLSADERNSIRKMFQEKQIEIIDIGSNICVKGNFNENRQEKMEELTRICRLASDMNAVSIRVFLGNFIIKHNNQKEIINHDNIVDFLKISCEVAASFSVEIWIETHNEYATGRKLDSLLRDVNKKNCGVIWDIMHPLEDNEEPEDTMMLLGKNCKHVHIKDGEPFKDKSYHSWKYTHMGKGKLPIKKILQILKNNNYQGYCSLEWESVWRKEIQGPGTEAEVVIPQYAGYMKKLEKELQ